MKRLDQRLVELGLAPSRAKARELIEAGEVQLRAPGGEWSTIALVSHRCGEGTEARVTPGAATLKYVSRGGLKLEAALARLGLDVRGWRCFDVGLSTGGFADCLLQHGAGEVAGIDVGRGQLHPSLRERVTSWESVNVRELAAHEPAREWLARGVQLCVVDVSFISLAHVLPVLGRALPGQARLLALVKPQFEVGAENLNRRGVVSDERLFAGVESRVLHLAMKCGFSKEDYFPSAVKGQDGNQEFFLYARRGSS